MKKLMSLFLLCHMGLGGMEQKDQKKIVGHYLRIEHLLRKESETIGKDDLNNLMQKVQNKPVSFSSKTLNILQKEFILNENGEIRDDVKDDLKLLFLCNKQFKEELGIREH